MKQYLTEFQRLSIEILCIREEILASERPAEARKTVTADSSGVVQRIATYKVQLSAYQQRVWIFTQPSVFLNAKTLESAAWWGLYAKHLPDLQKVATTVLAQVVSASAAQRNWSTSGRVKTKERSQLSHDKGDKLVSCKQAGERGEYHVGHRT